MRLRLQFIVLLFLTFTFGLFSVKNVFAANYTLSGSVKDNSSNAIAGATVLVNDANNDSTTTDSSGNYSLSIPSGTYNVQVAPPSGSNFSPAIALSQNISADTTLNFVLVPSGSVTLSGHVYDSQGNPLANQTVYIQAGSNPKITTTTDSSGNYSFTTSSGSYAIGAYANNNLSVNAPQYYIIFANSFSLSQSTILDIKLPLKKVTVHVQDASGNPMNSVEIKAANSGGIGSYINSNGLPMGGGITNGTGASVYGYNSSQSSISGPITDTSGNAILWLFPTDQFNKYAFTATPPSGSNYLKTTLSNISITGDTTETITMQLPVTLSGHVYDAQGNPLTNQTVYLQSSGNPKITATTDSSGQYSLTASPGTYQVGTYANNTLSVNAPQYYIVYADNYSLSQNSTLDITLPLKRVTIHTQDASGNPVASVEIKAASVFGVGSYINNSGLSIGGNITSGTGASVYGYNSSQSPISGPLTDASGNATLWLFPTNFSNKYIFTANPQNGSNFLTTTLSNQTITADTNLTITMQQQPVTLSGHVYDRQGNPLQNQTVYVQAGNNPKITATTNSTGEYSLSAVPGTYTLGVFANNNLSINAPQYYLVTKSNYSLSQNATLDITLPLKMISIHIQDVTGSPVASVELKATSTSGVGGIDNNNGLSIGGNITDATGTSIYGYNSSLSAITGPTTDSSGNVTLWLFPTNFTNQYVFTAIPPNGSVYNTFTLNNVTVTGDQTELISLQYNHATPVTTATLSTPFSDGLYPDPTNVTLSATTATGYTIANTYYTIDGGAQQTYATPFTVTGAGSHTITYWSVDSAGVPEAANTKTFTITEAYNLSGTVYLDANQNGVQDTGENGYAAATVMLNTGQTETTDTNGNYSFPNLEAGTYTETLTVPGGYNPTTTNPVSVPLAANTTENFGIAQQNVNTLVTAINAGGDTQGSYVADANFTGGTSYTSSATVDTTNVDNPAPQAVYQTVRYGNTFSYTIPNLTANGTYTVRLHFNEIYWGTPLAGNNGGAGSRVFNVSINGTQVLTNFDIYQTAGGGNKAIIEEFPVTADANGKISIQFSTVTDNAMVNGIEVN